MGAGELQPPKFEVPVRASASLYTLWKIGVILKEKEVSHPESYFWKIVHLLEIRFKDPKLGFVCIRVGIFCLFFFPLSV